MKKNKLYLTTYVLVTLLSLTSCGNNKPEPNNTPVSDNSIDEQDKNTESASESALNEYSGYKNYTFAGYSFMIPEYFTPAWGVEEEDLVLFEITSDDNSVYASIAFCSGAEISTAEELSNFENIISGVDEEDFVYNGFACKKNSLVYENTFLTMDTIENFNYFYSDYYTFTDINIQITIESSNETFGRDVLEVILSSISKAD